MLWLVLAAGVLMALTDYLPRWRGPPGNQVNEKTAISLLRSEAMAFLVTRRLTTQVVVEHIESSWFADWRGVLWATVRIHYGVDLQKIGMDDIRREGDVLIVTLPEPELLDFSLVPGSVGSLSKSTAIAKIEDIMKNGQRRLLEERLRDQALEFARQHDQMPSREQIVQQLNAAAAPLMGAGVELRFE